MAESVCRQVWAQHTHRLAQRNQQPPAVLVRPAAHTHQHPAGEQPRFQLQPVLAVAQDLQQKRLQQSLPDLAASLRQ